MKAFGKTHSAILVCIFLLDTEFSEPASSKTWWLVATADARIWSIARSYGVKNIIAISEHLIWIEFMNTSYKINLRWKPYLTCHYNDVIMGAMASQITSLAIVCSNVYSGADQRKHQSSASLAFVGGNHRGPMNSRHKWPVTRKMFPFDDVIICW